jgi:hypothetical protein
MPCSIRPPKPSTLGRDVPTGYRDTGQAVLRFHGPVSPWNRPTVRDVMRQTGTEAKARWLTETGRNTAEVSGEAQAASCAQHKCADVH